MEQLNKEKIDLDNHKLKEILDEELRDRILNINKKQLSKIGEMSYYYFIGSSMVLVQLHTTTPCIIYFKYTKCYSFGGKSKLPRGRSSTTCIKLGIDGI